MVGVGLIGGSVGLGLRRRGLARSVIGVGRDRDRLEIARRLGAIDEVATDFESAVADADLVVLATPVDRIAQEARRAAAIGNDRLLITDVGSTKGAIVAEVEADAWARSRFVGAHPIAGSERSGVESARDDLFEGQPCVVVETDATPQDRLARARDFWTALGARVMTMGPEAHDRALALTSHLPHVSAAALAQVVGPEAVGLAAGAYRDATRVAASDADLWTAIFLQNRRPLLNALDRFDAELGRFRDALEAADGPAIRNYWQSARESRREFERLTDRPGTATPGPQTDSRSDT